MVPLPAESDVALLDKELVTQYGTTVAGGTAAPILPQDNVVTSFCIQFTCNNAAVPPTAKCIDMPNLSWSMLYIQTHLTDSVVL